MLMFCAQSNAKSIALHLLPQELVGRQHNRPKAEVLKDPSAVLLAEGPKAKKMLSKAEK